MPKSSGRQRVPALDAVLQQQPGLPVGAAVDGVDAFGLLQDLSGELPDWDEKGLEPEDRGLLAVVGIHKEEW